MVYIKRKPLIMCERTINAKKLLLRDIVIIGPMDRLVDDFTKSNVRSERK